MISQRLISYLLSFVTGEWMLSTNKANISLKTTGFDITFPAFSIRIMCKTHIFLITEQIQFIFRTKVLL